MVSFLDLFVPLTGRTGEISPSDHIIATIVAALSFMSLPIVLPLSHRYGPQRITQAIVGLLIFTSISIAVFASPSFSPWTPLTPKRIFVHQVENITDGTWSMNMGHADAAPGHWQLVDDVRNALVPDYAPAVKQVMDGEYHHTLLAQAPCYRVDLILFRTHRSRREQYCLRHSAPRQRVLDTLQVQPTVALGLWSSLALVFAQHLHRHVERRRVGFGSWNEARHDRSQQARSDLVRDRFSRRRLGVGLAWRFATQRR